MIFQTILVLNSLPTEAVVDPDNLLYDDGSEVLYDDGSNVEYEIT